MNDAIQPSPPQPREGRQPRAPDPLGTPVRRAAMRLLDAVLRRGEPLEAALAGATRGLHGGPDRGLAHAIVAETLRWLPDLDALIDSATQRVLPDDAKARAALRIALVQTLALGTPPHAAIATMLPLVDGGPRKLVHGVFGTLMRQGAKLPAVPTLPPAVAERWERYWGTEAAAAAARAIATQPPLDLTLSDMSWAEELGGETLMPGHVRLTATVPVPKLPGFDAGGWWVQDIAASLPARLAGRPSEPGGGIAIDLCAAPGGKTLQLASAGWRVTAVDSSENRLVRLRENLSRTNMSASVLCVDALDWTPEAPAEVVLLDAPCSASGIFRRHPDVLHRVRPAIVAEMAELQAKLLARAADWVRPGGVLIYATCSLEPEEGEMQVEALLAARDDYTIVRPTADELPTGIEAHERGWLRLLPGTLEAEGGCDGFFIARLRRD